MLRTLLASSALALGALAYSTIRATPLTQDAPTATEHHDSLLRRVGRWEGTLTAFMPGVPSEPAPAQERVIGIGEFWTQAIFNCEFMGAPYRGTGCLGYDPVKQKYVGTWIDSGSSELAMMEGERDPETQALTMRWSSLDPATGNPVPHRSVTTLEKGKRTTTFYMGDGEGTRSMVIEMQRRPAASDK